MRHFYCHKNINHSWLKKTKKKYRSYPASILEEHAQRRQEDGDQDLAESRSGASLPHCAKISLSNANNTDVECRELSNKSSIESLKNPLNCKNTNTNLRTIELPQNHFLISKCTREMETGKQFTNSRQPSTTTPKALAMGSIYMGSAGAGNPIRRPSMCDLTIGRFQ
jgi:hypothetical protein